MEEKSKHHWSHKCRKRTDNKHDINLKLVTFYFSVLNDSFPAKSKFIFYKHRDNCECTLGNTEVVLTFHFHPGQSKPPTVAHHHQFSLKEKPDFFFFFRYIDAFQFYLSKKQYVTCTSDVIVEFLDIFLGLKTRSVL